MEYWSDGIMGDGLWMGLSDHNPSSKPSAAIIDPNIPTFHYSSIPGQLFMTKPNGSDLAQRTRFLLLE